MDNHSDRFPKDERDTFPISSTAKTSSIFNGSVTQPEHTTVSGGNPNLNAQPLSKNTTNRFVPSPPTTPSSPSSGQNDPSAPERSHVPSTLIPKRTQEEMASSQMVASGTAGAVIGFFLRGPFFAALSGFGLAYASTQAQGATGDVARAAGDVALFVRSKAQELNAKHNFEDKFKTSLAEGWDQAKQLDQRHGIVEQFQDFVRFSWRETVEFASRHRLLERGVEGIGTGVAFVSQQFSYIQNDTTATGNVAMNLPSENSRQSKESGPESAPRTY